MNQSSAVTALHALAQDTRLSVFRMLIQAGSDGLIAGAIAERLGVPASTMSHHLANLEAAGLVTATRDGRLINYVADYAGVRDLLAFLVEDCCGGRPELCGGLGVMTDCNTEHHGAL